MRYWVRRSRLQLAASASARALKGIKRAATRLGRERADERAGLAEHRNHVETYFSTHAVRKLQIGTGANALPGWLNTDLEPSSPGTVRLDVLERFPFRDELFDYVFAEHVLEHVTYRNGLAMLAEAYRVLKPGAKIRIATPDIERIVGLLARAKTEDQRRYVEWATAHMGLYSPQVSDLQRHRPEWAIDHEHIRAYFPDPAEDCAAFVVNNFFRSYGHRFLYDERTLSRALSATGFIDLVWRRPGESDDEHLRAVESHGRCIGEEPNRFETMVIEGTKPGGGSRPSDRSRPGVRQ